jgi:hypothetical protein
LNPKPYGDLDETRLESLENILGQAIPSDYRRFLHQFNGGVPSPSFFWIEEGIEGTGVHQFYGLHDGPRHLSIDTYCGDQRYGIPQGFLAIADDGVGNTILLAITGEDRGSIFFLDHETHPYDMPDSMEGVTKIANSFLAFMALLTSEPNNHKGAP